MDEQTILDEIQDILRFITYRNGATARIIQVALKDQNDLIVSKAEVNRILYKYEHKKFKKVDGNGTAPQWVNINVCNDDEPEVEYKNDKSSQFLWHHDRDAIFIDLGNCHGIIETLSSEYLSKFDIIAFADRAYKVSKHFGSFVSIVQAKDSHRNAADCWLQFHFYSKCLSSTTGRTLYVCTKDQGLYPMREIAESYGHQTIFCVSWEELRNHIEG